MEVIHRRSREIDNREVKIESWESLKKRLEAKIETHPEASDELDVSVDWYL